jgi:hypothetical protein
MKIKISAQEIIDVVNNISGDALPYIVTDEFDKQLPDNCDISFADFSDRLVMDCEMKKIGVTKRKPPYDLVYSEGLCDFKKIIKILNEKGKIIIVCNSDEVGHIVQKAHKEEFFWCEKKQYHKFSIIVFRKVRKVKNPWSGEKFKKLFIYSEHGWGDIFHKIRYVPIIGGMFDGEIIIETRRGIEKLFKNCFPQFSYVRKGQMKIEDYPAIELCYIDRILGKEIGQKSKTPYIKLNSTKEHENKIGVAWQGHRLTFNKQRDVSPLIFEELNKNWEIYCIQKFLEKSNFPNFIKFKKINDWWDTANLINEMKIIISIDTSVAHLAGAMGKDTRVILQKNHYYTPLNKNPSWYPTVKVYKEDNWDCTIKSVSNDINLHYKFKIL